MKKYTLNYFPNKARKVGTKLHPGGMEVGGGDKKCVPIFIV